MHEGTYRFLNVRGSAFLEELRRQSILASGRTSPNPTVAALAFHSGRPDFFSSGATEPAGSRHAEIVALDAWRERYSTEPDSIVVTLEPCSRTGRTPPCVDRILSIPSLKYIYTGSLDPTLNGEGLARLANGGRIVHCLDESGRILLKVGAATTNGGGSDVGLLSEGIASADQKSDLVDFLNDLKQISLTFCGGFLFRVSENRPRLIFKAATYADGLMGNRSQRLMISGPGALQAGQLMRRCCDAVLVGPGTAMADRPGLDWRPGGGAGQDVPLQELETLPAVSEIEDQSLERDFREELASLWIRCALHYSKEPMMNDPQFDHQPMRILIRPAFRSPDQQKAWEQLISRQRGVDEKLYIIDSSELPRPDDAGFGSALTDRLAALGLNSVLVEGGPGLFRQLAPEMREQDFFYWLRNRADPGKVIPGYAADPSFDPVYLPHWLQNAKHVSTLDLGDDELIVLRMPPEKLS
jgi:diaminohydroxyphosphoribosylaminopyrimidine deaminase/5-amino-6-(5-phosphoribosylamino)uracil reductase